MVLVDASLGDLQQVMGCVQGTPGPLHGDSMGVEQAARALPAPGDPGGGVEALAQSAS